MSERHDSGPGAHITYGQLSLLEPADSLNAVVHRYRDAQLKLDAIPAAEVIGIRPTGFASSMALGSAPLTVIEVQTLPDDIRESLSAETGVNVDEFQLIRIGRADREYPNRSLSEYSG
jgi:hypothetical protein